PRDGLNQRNPKTQTSPEAISFGGRFAQNRLRGGFGGLKALLPVKREIARLAGAFPRTGDGHPQKNRMDVLTLESGFSAPAP
ncbi:MAG: hypothetical protein RR035_07010, partial [Oscillibacter sp.]